MDHAVSPSYVASSGTVSSYYDLTAQSFERFDGGDNKTFFMGDGAGNDFEFTATAWIKPDALSGSGIIVRKDDGGSAPGWQLRLNGSEIQSHTRSGTSSVIGRNTSSGATAIGVWQKITMTYNGDETSSGHRHYVNGVRTDDSNQIIGGYSGMVDNTAQVRIGSGSGGGDIDACVSHVYVWKGTELTAEEELAEFERTAVKFGYLDGIDVNVDPANSFLTTNLVLASSYEYDAAADQSGNNYHGTNNGATHTVDSSGDFAFYDFNGTSNYIDYGDEADFSVGASPFTVSVWVRKEDVWNEAIIGKYGSQREWYLWANSGCSPRITIHDDTTGGSNTLIGTSSPGQDNWNNIVVTYDGSGGTTGDFKLYINGELDAWDSSTPSGTFTQFRDTTASLTVGNTDSGSLHWTGKIDDVRFYTGVEWTAEQVYTAYELSPHYEDENSSSSSSSSSS
jgi:hypothetical protein